MRFERIIAFTLLAGSSFGQNHDLSQLDALFTRAAVDVRSGLEALIVQNGQQIYWKQFGNWPVNNQVEIASGTKWLSGAVIMSLVDGGILSLDDRASRYLPYMNGDKAEITLRQLMSHTSGFAGEFPLVDSCLGDSSVTLDQCAQAIAKAPLQSPPGTAFIYSGAGMQIAGRVAEVATGKDWQTLFRERIAGPLGMSASDYEYRGPTQNPRISGGARSTVSDYMRFLTMFYQRGMFEGRRILSTRAVDVMLSDQTRGAPIVESPFGRLDDRYGIGNWLEDVDSQSRSLVNSSLGALGWSPMIDASRNLLVVVGMRTPAGNFQPHYLEMKRVLGSVIPPAALTPRGVTNAASYEAGPLSPGEFVVLFGSGLGPDQLVSQPLSGDLIANALAGTQVLFDDVAAPVLYTSSGQVGAIVPFAIEGKQSSLVQVVHNGRRSPAVPVRVGDAWPALWSADARGSGPGAILNQDGSVNTAENPAARGSVVQLFGTGAGKTVPPGQDGRVAHQPGSFALPISVTIGGISAPGIHYAGPAPGQVAGAFQLNVTIPMEVSAGFSVPVVVTVGESTSPASVTVAVR